MLKIDNKSSLNFQGIGFIVDDILKSNIGTTNYVGKWNYYEYELNNKKYRIETLQLKNDFKLHIKDLVEKVED